MNATAVVQEEEEDKAFGEEVSLLFLGLDLVAGELLGSELPEPVPLGQEVLGPVGDALVGREIKCRLVVLKGTSLNGGSNLFVDR